MTFCHIKLHLSLDSHCVRLSRSTWRVSQCEREKIIEPRHDKTNKVTVRLAKVQISLGIRPVWTESSLSAWRNTGSSATQWAHWEHSDQTGRMPRLIWVFAGRPCHFDGFVMRWLIILYNSVICQTYRKNKCNFFYISAIFAVRIDLSFLKYALYCEYCFFFLLF